MKGKDGHIRRLKRLQKDAVKAVGRVLYVGSDMIRAEAHRGISAGSVSGKRHQPAKPGEYPNRDSGVLQAHITNQLVEPMLAEVRSDAPYSAALEFGTSTMAPRPHMRPARDAKVREINELFAKEMSKVVKGSGR